MSAAARTPAPAATDHELVAAVARGDLEALGTLFERHQAAVRRYLGRLGIAASDADDLVQSAFLEVVHASVRLDAQHSVRSWLFGIATMTARRHRRSLSRYAARIASWAAQVRAAPALSPTPCDDVESGRALRRIERAFARLSAEKREAFVLVTLEGLSGQEAAVALGVPVNTVWTRLHHARRALRDALAEDQS